MKRLESFGTVAHIHVASKKTDVSFLYQKKYSK